MSRAGRGALLCLTLLGTTPGCHREESEGAEDTATGAGTDSAASAASTVPPSGDTTSGNAADTNPDAARRPATGKARGPGGTAPAPATATDTARGIVRIVGNEPVATLVLETTPGSAAPLLALGGEAADLLRGVAGLEVKVEGRLTTERVPSAAPGGAPLFQASRFVVRASDGAPAADGLLIVRDGDHVLRLTEGGERRIAVLPPALRDRVGARVFLVGPLDRMPSAFGVISAAP